MLENKDYCDYETCVALKELGYNRGAYAYYFPNHKEDLIFNTHQMRGCSINEMLKGYNTYPKDVMGHELIDAPTMWEAQKWLREGHNLHIEVRWYIMWYEYEVKEAEGKVVAEGSAFPTYEEALSTAVRMAVEHLKEK